MLPDNLELRVFPRMWNDDYGFFLAFDDSGKRSIGVSVTFEQVERGAYHPDPTFALTPERAQKLIDELWGAGLRPSQGKQSEGVTAAQARHLEDMRAIAFDRLKVERPA